jgi:hypothetical protein
MFQHNTFLVATFLGLDKPENQIAAIGVVAAVVAIFVAFICVNLTIRKTSREEALRDLRNELLEILEELEAFLRRFPTSPSTSDVNALSTVFWKAKERFKVVCNKARLVVKPRLIKPAIDALPRLDKDYDHFKDAMLNKHTIDNKVLNHFKAEMYMVLSEVEQLIAMTFLRFWQRSEARKLAQQRADFVAEITGI